jgi:chemotaxis protein methyltransferase CheR
LRIWSAGCASGEEPYSIALLLDQFGAAGRARILATDISRPALARAAHGVYGPWSLRDVPEDVRRRYFRDTGRQFEIMPALRSQVELRHHNLASTTWPTPADGLGSMDLILCRNVLIYFDQATVTRVAGRLLDCLAEDGCLVLGASDPIIAGLVPCEVEITQAGLVYHRSLPARHAAPRSEPAAPPHPARVLPRKTSPTARSLCDGPGSPAPDALSEARSRYAERDYAGAAEVVLAALELGERSAALEILLVRSLANRGQLSDAGRACAAALDVYRSEPELVVLHAVLLAHAGYHAEAADALRRALYLDRHLAVAHLALGETLARLGDREGAVRELRAARQLLEQLPGEQPVTASDGEPAARLAELVRTHLQLLEGSAA